MLESLLEKKEQFTDLKKNMKSLDFRQKVLTPRSPDGYYSYRFFIFSNESNFIYQFELSNFQATGMYTIQFQAKYTRVPDQIAVCEIEVMHLPEQRPKFQLTRMYCAQGRM